MTIIVVSCNHFPDDERIYHRQIKTLLEALLIVSQYNKLSCMESRN